MKRGLCLFLCLTFAISILASCNKTEEHSHTYAATWSYDETNHWHNAACEHSDQKSAVGTHIDADANDICDVCGYIKDHTHTYETEWTLTEKTHYYKSTCGHEVKKDEADHTDADNNGTCDVCSYDGGHVHTYADEWSSDNTSHWHAANCGHTVEAKDKAEHTDADNDGICDICSSNGGHEHTYADEWSTDADNHWKEVTCGHTIEVGSHGVHIDANNDNECDTCAFVPEHIHSFETELSSDKDGHYYKSTCGHDDVKKDFATHDDADENGVCNTCQYVIFRLYTVTVNAPDYLTVDKTITAKEGTDVIIKITVPNSAEIVEVVGATVVGNPVAVENGHIHTYKIAGISKNETVTVTGNTFIAAEVVVDSEGSLTVGSTSAFYYYDDITFTAPSAGRYMIFSNTNAEVAFGGTAADATFVQIYVFDVDKAGDFAVKARAFLFSPPEGGKVDFDYYICKIDDNLTLKSATGSGYTMPANAVITISYTVPTAGLYQVTSSVSGLAWDDYLTNVHLFEATEDGEVITFTLKLDDITKTTFVFDWEIKPFDYTEIATGDNNITVPLGKYAPVSFTVPKTGAYKFTLNNQYTNLFTWNDEYKIMYNIGSESTQELTSGDVVYMYVYAYDIDGNVTGDIDEVINVEFVGRVVNSNNGRYPSNAGPDGETNAFVNDYVDGIYKLEAPANALISVDDGATWAESVEVRIEAYATLVYMVKSTNGATEVNITITHITYEFTLRVGTETETMIPGKEYQVSLSGFTGSSYYHSFILNWDNENITVIYGANPLTSGSQGNNYSTSDYLIIVYNGDSEANIKFTLVEVTDSGSGSGSSGGSSGETGSQTLILGENAIEVSYWGNVNATFTASVDGTYILSAAEGESNANVIIEDGWVSETIDLPYRFTLTAGESITFTIMTGNYEADTIDLVISVA